MTWGRMGAWKAALSSHVDENLSIWQEATVYIQALYFNEICRVIGPE